MMNQKIGPDEQIFRLEEIVQKGETMISKELERMRKLTIRQDSPIRIPAAFIIDFSSSMHNYRELNRQVLRVLLDAIHSVGKRDFTILIDVIYGGKVIPLYFGDYRDTSEYDGFRSSVTINKGLDVEQLFHNLPPKGLGMSPIHLALSHVNKTFNRLMEVLDENGHTAYHTNPFVFLVTDEQPTDDETSNLINDFSNKIMDGEWIFCMFSTEKNMDGLRLPHFKIPIDKGEETTKKLINLSKCFRTASSTDVVKYSAADNKRRTPIPPRSDKVSYNQYICDLFTSAFANHYEALMQDEEDQ